MDEILDELEARTADIRENLDQIDYEELASFVELRERIVDKMKQLSSPFPQTVKHRQQMEHILECDRAILQRMMVLREEALYSIQKAGQSRKMRSTYDMDSVPISMFYDRKR